MKKKNMTVNYNDFSINYISNNNNILPSLIITIKMYCFKIIIMYLRIRKRFSLPT